MRILYSHYLADDQHPAVQMVHAIAGELRRMHHEVVVHRSQGPGKEAEAKLDNRARSGGVTAALKSRLWFLKEIWRNRAYSRSDAEILQSFTPDIILTRQDAYCDSMARHAWEHHIPLVTYADAPVAYESRLFPIAGRWHPPRLVEWIEKRVLEGSKAIITVSRPAAERLKQYGLDTPIHVVSNGIDPLRFPKHSDAEREVRRSTLGLTAPIVIGFLGTFRAFHGIDRLRELMLATTDRQDVQWLLIGDGHERESLQKATSGKVSAVFMGRQPSERIGSLLGLIDIAVAPHAMIAGDFYFCPLKILEYAAAGCAIVASDQGDIPRLLHDGQAGVIVSRPDLQSWVEALTGLLDHPARVRELGAIARDYVMHNFTWRKTAEQVEAVLSSAYNTTKKEKAT